MTGRRCPVCNQLAQGQAGIICTFCKRHQHRHCTDYRWMPGQFLCITCQFPAQAACSYTEKVEKEEDGETAVKSLLWHCAQGEVEAPSPPMQMPMQTPVSCPQQAQRLPEASRVPVPRSVMSVRLQDLGQPPAELMGLNEWFTVFEQLTAGYTEEQRVFFLLERLGKEPKFFPVVQAARSQNVMFGTAITAASLKKSARASISYGRRDYQRLRSFLSTLRQKADEEHREYHTRVLAQALGLLPDDSPLSVELQDTMLQAFINGFYSEALRIECHHPRGGIPPPSTLDEAVELAERIFPLAARWKQGYPPLPQNARPPTTVTAPQRLSCSHCVQRGCPPSLTTHDTERCIYKFNGPWIQPDRAARPGAQSQGGHQPPRPPPQQPGSVVHIKGLQTTNDSPHALVYFGETPVSVLLDTGATANCVSRHFVDSLDPASVCQTRLTHVTTVCFAQGGKDEIKYTVRLGFAFDNDHGLLTQAFLVVEGLGEPCILGMTFLHSTEAIIYCSEPRMTLRYRKFAKQSQKKNPRVTIPLLTTVKWAADGSTPIYQSTRERIGVQSVRRLFFHVGHDSEHNTFLIKPDGPQSPYIVESCNGLLPYYQDNKGLTPKVLVEGQLLGSLESVRKEEIRTVSSVTTDDITSEDTHRQFLEANLDLSSSSLSAEEQLGLRKLLLRHSLEFSTGPDDLGRTNVTQHHIDVQGAAPYKQRPYRMTPEQRDRVDENVEKMLHEKIIRESNSPWSSPVVIVTKKDGTDRFCIDFRKLNSLSRRDSYPLPLIEDLLLSLKGAKVFSSLDAASGYWQVGMAEDDKEKTAFVTHRGLFEFEVMPFGLTNAPATFQRMMNSVLRDLLYNGCLVYIDDILVYGRTVEEHNERLEAVLSRLRDAGIKLKLKKCRFATNTLEYLGEVITEDGTKPNPDKIAKVVELQVPKDREELKHVLGLMGFYQRYLRNFATRAKPMTALLKKDVPFIWTTSCDRALTDLKTALTEAPVLAQPDYTRPFQLSVDASGVGCGAVLEQEDEAGNIRPIAYTSHTFSDTEGRYPCPHQEAFAVRWAVNKFRHFLSQPFTVYTDHRNLQYLLTSQQAHRRMQQYAYELQSYPITICWRPGKQQGHVDALSRLGHNKGGSGQLQQAAAVVTAVTLQPQPRLSPTPQIIRKYRLVWRDGRYLFKGDRPFIPVSDRHEVLRDLHRKANQHAGARSLQKSLTRSVFWPRMHRDAHSFVSECQACLACKKAVNANPGILPFREEPGILHLDWGTMDTSGVCPRYGLFLIGRDDSLPTAIYPTDKRTAAEVLLALQDYCRTKGTPKVLVADNAKEFVSKALQQFCKKRQMQLRHSAPYRPQTNGKVERFVQTAKERLRTIMYDSDDKDWTHHLAAFLDTYTPPQQSSAELNQKPKEPVTGQPLSAFAPGQLILIRRRPTPPLVEPLYFGPVSIEAVFQRGVLFQKGSGTGYADVRDIKAVSAEAGRKMEEARAQDVDEPDLDSSSSLLRPTVSTETETDETEVSDVLIDDSSYQTGKEEEGSDVSGANDVTDALIDASDSDSFRTCEEGKTEENED